jgi:uracil-DNA glycosylase family 4
MLTIELNGSGNPNATIAFVGDAPSAIDIARGKHFQGQVGRVFDELLRNVHLSRNELYITTVSKQQIPGNNIKLLRDIDEHVEYLIKELKSLNPKVIVALGNTALHALTGKTGIDLWRGSILRCSALPNIIVIPTYQLTNLLRTDSIIDAAVVQFDLERAKAESYKPQDLPYRNLVVCKTSEQLYNYMSRHSGKSLVSSDIEVYRSIPVCTGFGFSPAEAISIPMFSEIWGVKFGNYPQSELARFWKVIDQVLRESEIVGQNFKFDEAKLTQLGFRIPKFKADTMLMAATRSPELPKGLDFLTSILTREPYYKHEGKEFNPKKDNPEQLFLYNAKDCAVEYEIYLRLLEHLEQFGVKDFYFNFVHRLHALYLGIEREGVLVDENMRDTLRTKYQILREEKQEQLNALVGRPLNVMSPQQVAKYIYVDNKIRGFKGGTGEEIITQILANHTEKRPRFAEALMLILELRTIRKTLGTYIEAKPDYDGRMRTQYKIVGTETGRTSTVKYDPPMRVTSVGIAWHTITKHSKYGSDIFAMYVPDPGYVYLEVDQSQAEARVVDLLAEDYEGLAEYGKLDKHAKTARIVLELGPNFPITKASPERFIGKTTRHAASYDMRKHRAMLTINTDAKKYGINIRVSEWKAGQLLDRFHAAHPKIRNVFHKSVQEALNTNNRVLVNPFGRKREFLGRWGEELFKEAYAQIPQSTVSDLTKLIALNCRDQIHGIRIVMEKHDALGFLIPKAELEKYARAIYKAGDIELDFANCTIPRGKLKIPLDFEVAYDNLKNLEHYKFEV